MEQPPIPPTNYPRPNLELARGEPCPTCLSRATDRVKFTWWGGAVGPWMMSLTKCRACGTQFNSKTRKPVGSAILVYNVIAIAITLFVLAMIFRPT